MRALVIMHVENEGPGVFGELLEAAGATVQVARLHLGDALPAPGDVDAALSMGGPMNVYEEERYPFLRAETRFLQLAAEIRLPILGICLGAQMIAKAAGAAVTKNHVEEVGWSSVNLTAAGEDDLLFHGLPPVLPVFQWHGDTFAIPEGGRLLATGSECRNQAFGYRGSYGLQFHLEADRGLLASWFAGNDAGPGILRQCDELAPQVGRHVRTLFANFLEIARQRLDDAALPETLELLPRIERVLASLAGRHPGIIAEAVVAGILAGYDLMPRERHHRERRKNHAERIRRFSYEVYRIVAGAAGLDPAREIAARVAKAFILARKGDGPRIESRAEPSA